MIGSASRARVQKDKKVLRLKKLSFNQLLTFIFRLPTKMLLKTLLISLTIGISLVNSYSTNHNKGQMTSKFNVLDFNIQVDESKTELICHQRGLCVVRQYSCFGSHLPFFLQELLFRYKKRLKQLQ